MPTIVKRAETDRRRMLLGFAGIYGLAGLQGVSAVSMLTHARGPVDVARALLIVSISGAVVVAAHLAMRGNFREDGAAANALLDAMERRHAGRRRLMRAMPWLTAAAVAGTVGVTVAQMIADGRFEPGLAVGMVATCGFTIAVVWATLARVGKTIDRELREVAEARRLLAED